MATDDDKRKDGKWAGHLRMASWDKIILFPLWFPCFLFDALFSTGEERKLTRRQVKAVYKRWGFAPYAFEFIFFGGITMLIFSGMSYSNQRSYPAIGGVGLGLLYIGVGYFFFKLYLIGVSQTFKAAKKGIVEAAPTSVQHTPPPDDIEARLQRLEGLKEKGLLTDAEYQAKREEILGEV
tara:strand:+ start:438 stop:977 length:540 start_codon:yes stop_codon:yes gene_type:complete